VSDFQQITLEYKPTTLDYSPRLPRGLPGSVRRSHFLAVIEPATHFVHGNSTVVVNKNGLDVSDKYITWRRWRVWTPTDLEKPDWGDDNQSKKPNWMDIPGMIFIKGPKEWTDELSPSSAP